MRKRCIVCEAEFEARDRTIVCSEKCRAEKKRRAWQDFRSRNSHQISARKAARRLEAKLSEAPRQCIVCGTDITALRRTRIVCSDGCKAARRNDLEKARNKGTHRDCAVCGNQFQVTSSDLTCSPSCHERRQEEIKAARRPQNRIRDRERYWRDREKRLAAESERRRKRAAAMRLVRELQTNPEKVLL